MTTTSGPLADDLSAFVAGADHPEWSPHPPVSTMANFGSPKIYACNLRRPHPQKWKSTSQRRETHLCRRNSEVLWLGSQPSERETQAIFSPLNPTNGDQQSSEGSDGRFCSMENGEKKERIIGEEGQGLKPPKQFGFNAYVDIDGHKILASKKSCGFARKRPKGQG